MLSASKSDEISTAPTKRGSTHCAQFCVAYVNKPDYSVFKRIYYFTAKSVVLRHCTGDCLFRCCSYALMALYIVLALT
jgi:hypothetical protein